MKIETSIRPRKDGSLTASMPDGTRYAFAKDGHNMVAEVDNEAHIAFLLASGNFSPADDSDFDAALAMVADGSDDSDFDVVDESAAPIEVATPVKSKSGQKPTGAR